MSALTENQNKFYFPEIDSLRFLAFLLVFLGHMPFAVTSFFPQLAWYGVEFFFLLSGFLLTKLLYAEYQLKKTINFKFYFVRRILRIWPLYFSFVSGLFFLSVFVIHFAYPVRRFLGNIFFVDNIFKAAGLPNENLWSGHLWTISVEEQYYLALPFLAMWLFPKTKPGIKRIFIFIFLLLASLKLIAILLKFRYPFIHSLPLSADSFLMGVYIGIFHKELSTISKQRSFLFFISGILLLLFVFLMPDKSIVGYHLLLIYPLQAAGFSLILSGIIISNDSPLNKLLKNRTLVFLGKISFGLYIFHFPVTNNIAPYFKTKSIPLQVSGLVFILFVTAIFAIASYYIIEKPFLSLKKRYRIAHSGE